MRIRRIRVGGRKCKREEKKEERRRKREERESKRGSRQLVMGGHLSKRKIDHRESEARVTPASGSSCCPPVPL